MGNSEVDNMQEYERKDKKYFPDLEEWKEVDTGKAQPLFHTFPVINIFREDETAEQTVRTGKAEEEKLLIGRKGILYDSSENVTPEAAFLVQREGGILLTEEEQEESADFSLVMDDDGACLELALTTGQVGLKPTAGLISRYGMRVRTPSLERIGLIARDVTLAACVLEAVAGVDPKDPMSRDAYVYDYRGALKADMMDMKLGIIGNLEDITQEQRQDFDEMLLVLAEQGAELHSVSLDWEEHIERTDACIYSAERRMTAGVELLQPEQEEWDDLSFGEWLLEEEQYEEIYLKILKLRSLIKDSYDLLLREYDLLVVPFVCREESDRLNPYVLGANLAGLPMMTTAGKDSDGAIGMCFIAGANAESKLIRAAYTYEQKGK